MTKTIYISGPISGIDPAVAETRFARVQMDLEAKGFNVYNPFTQVPFEIQLIQSFKEANVPTPFYRNYVPEVWGDCMRIALYAMLKSHEVVMLPGWQDSKGATIERDLALRLGIPVLYLETL